MTPQNMLELQKLVLENVKDDSLLFEKELKKSFKWLEYEDLKNLYFWAKTNFNNQYNHLIDCVFAGFNFILPPQLNNPNSSALLVKS